MKVEEIVRVLDGLAPLRHAESWDNVGLVVGDPSAEVTKLLVTVDYSSAVAEEARSLGVQMVVAYHPPMFAAVKRVPHDALWADAVRRNIALYTMHTALDVVSGGTNDVLADACGVGERKPIRPTPEDPSIGQGRIGRASGTRREAIDRLKSTFGLDRVMVSGPLDAPVTRIGVAAGAGGELLSSAIRAGVDLFVTGELRHHDALEASRRGVTTVATLHSNSERKGVARFASRLSLEGVEIRISAADRDPFTFV